jgi:ankyrin repeat protein
MGFVQNTEALVSAAENGHAEVSKLLLAAGADINSRDKVNAAVLISMRC